MKANKALKITLLVSCLLAYSLLTAMINTRTCLFFNLFKIPCPGCGLTRASILILQLKIVESFKYNIIAIPVLLFIIFLILGNLYDYIYKVKKMNQLLTKYQTGLIIISIILMIISWLYNLNNPLLY